MKIKITGVNAKLLDATHLDTEGSRCQCSQEGSVISVCKDEGTKGHEMKLGQGNPQEAGLCAESR